jgi:addiction module HigA family antidote
MRLWKLEQRGVPHLLDAPAYKMRAIENDVVEFMDPLNLTQGQMADWLDVERRRINEIIRGKREVTPDTAVRLGKAFGVSPQFWLLLQMRTNLWVALQDQGAEYAHIKLITDGTKITPGDTTGK